MCDTATPTPFAKEEGCGDGSFVGRNNGSINQIASCMCSTCTCINHMSSFMSELDEDAWLGLCCIMLYQQSYREAGTQPQPLKKQFVSESDIFVSLSTGYGRTLLFANGLFHFNNLN